MGSGPWGNAIFNALRPTSGCVVSGAFGSTEPECIGGALGMDTAISSRTGAAKGWMAMTCAGPRRAASPETAGPTAARAAISVTKIGIEGSQ